MSPFLLNCTSSVTITIVNIGEFNEKNFINFGITKAHFGEGSELGEMRNDWIINLINGSKYNNNKK